jgi:hypothetical protein
MNEFLLHHLPLCVSISCCQAGVSDHASYDHSWYMVRKRRNLRLKICNSEIANPPLGSCRYIVTVFSALIDLSSCLKKKFLISNVACQLRQVPLPGTSLALFNEKLQAFNHITGTHNQQGGESHE